MQILNSSWLQKSFSAACVAMALALPATAPAQYGRPPQPYYQGGWDAPPAEFSEVRREGFHDGVVGAQKDFDHHHYPNVENRKEFRHPHVEPALRVDYREGFRAGYDRAMNHLLHERGR